MKHETPKQREECLAFECLQRNLQGLVFVEAMDRSGASSAPDILAEFHASKIAIEMTSVDRDHSRMAKASHQDRLLEETLTILREEIHHTNGMVLNVQVLWTAHHATISRKEIPEYARHLASWIMQRLPNPIPVGFFLDGLPDWDLNAPACLHEWISDLRIATYEVTDPREVDSPADSRVEICSAGGSPCRPGVSIAAIKQVIREKADKLAGYREHFDGPIWLLLHCNFTDFRMPLDCSEAMIEIACDHGFDRIFLIDHLTDYVIEIFRPKSESL